PRTPSPASSSWRGRGDPCGARRRATENDWPDAGHFAGRYHSFDFLLRAFFRCGDGAFPIEATSIAPPGGESFGPYEIHTTFPRKSASSSKRPAARRRIGERDPDRVVPFLLMGGTAGRTRSSVAGWHYDLCRCGAAL